MLTNENHKRITPQNSCLLEESNHTIFATIKAAKELGLDQEEIEALPFTLDECHIMAMATKHAYDILSELSESL